MAKQRKSYTLQRVEPFVRGNDALVVGVCAGVAQHFELDAIVVRVAFIILIVCSCGLMLIPYALLSFVLPSASPKETTPIDIDPLSVSSEVYSQAVDPVGSDRQGSFATSFYGANTGFAHMPPTPPVKEDGSRAQSFPQLVITRYPAQMSTVKRSLLVFVLAFSLILVFVTLALFLLPVLPHAGLPGCWPLLLVVGGTTALVCFSDKLCLAFRICVLVACVELCASLLPFTLDFCPISSLANVHAGFIVLWTLALVLVLLSLARRNVVLCILGISLLVLAMACIFVDVGLFERIRILSTYSHHDLTSSLFRR